ncbi:MAG TPA: C4-type zinc ribbon domain-containing protein [Terriglobales bacterium]|nr:C4-type zinc ribbon domain-containing protein [Terriglobales bacterium]
MDIDFDPIIQLQHLDSEIHATTQVLEGIPRLIQDIDKKIQAGSKAVAEAKEKIAQNQKRRRDLEGEVRDLKAQIGKYKRQLNEVKTNKEYTSFLKEIEDAQHRVDGLEEAIIAEMLAADDLEDEVKAAGLKQGQEEADLRGERQALEEKAREMETKKARLLGEREALLPGIPPEQMRLYEAVFLRKGGIALSPVKDDFCAMCHMRIRPQMLNEIRDRSKVILCENCGRILYWPAGSEPAPKTD